MELRQEIETLIDKALIHVSPSGGMKVRYFDTDQTAFQSIKGLYSTYFSDADICNSFFITHAEQDNNDGREIGSWGSREDIQKLPEYRRITLPIYRGVNELSSSILVQFPNVPGGRASIGFYRSYNLANDRPTRLVLPYSRPVTVKDETALITLLSRSKAR